MKYFILLFSLISFLGIAQPNPSADGILSGKVVDKISDKPMEYVSFRLFSAKDSSVVSGAFTDIDGKFTLENVPVGTYYARFTFSGYTTKEINDIKLSTTVKSLNLGTIKLELDNTINFEEVKVVGKLDVLKAGIDKKVYNVGEDLSVRGGTANDVLNNIPSVEVDQDGRIMLRGDGTVTVLIDGRPSSLSGGNGKSLLDALPAGSIERIEVVTNPSAKYDPDGTSGIINIVLKKNKLKGFNGMVSTNLGSGNLRNGNVADGTFSLSYRNSRLNAYGSYSGRYMTGYRNHYSHIEQSFLDGTVLQIDQQRYGTDLSLGNTFRLGSDFYLKSRNVLGVSLTGNIGQRDRTGEQYNRMLDGDANELDFWQRNSDDPTNQRNLDFNVNYKYDLKNERGDLIVDANQSLGNEYIEGFYDQYRLNADSSQIGDYTMRQRLKNNEQNNVTTVQSDFTYLYPKINARIETGLKAILRNQGVDTYSESFDTLNQTFYQDTLANFLYKYTEQIYSVYGIFGQQLGKFKYQGGVRFEKAYQIPDLISESNRIVNDYFNFFPSVHLRYEVKPKNELSVSYSRRINRAGSSNLNPFTNYSDPYNLQSGNPYLQPEFIDSYDFTYALEKKKVTMTASVFYRYTTDMITRVKNYFPDNTSLVTWANINKSHSVGTEWILIVKPTTWWRNTISANTNYIQFVDDTEGYDWNNRGINWNIKYAGTVDFWKKTASIQVNGNYIAPRVTVQGTARRRGALDISGEKKFKDGTYSVGFRVSDVFNRQGFEMEVIQPGINQKAEFKWLTRRYFVTFTYKFGKLEMSGKKPNGGGGEGGMDM